MEHKPNKIKEYYIAYFDILGYQAFFKETPEKTPEFLTTINSAISNTVQHIQSLNDSPLASQIANLHIQYKIFSDNIVLCIEVGTDNTKEKSRIIMFMGVIAEIQRKFITEYGLFLRGCLTKGSLSINADYLFGEGLIEAVKTEESTSHPRIAVSNKIISFLEKIQLYSQEEVNKAISIKNRVNSGEIVSDEEKNYYDNFENLLNQELLQHNLSLQFLYLCDDNVWCLSYLYSMDIRSYIPEQELSQTMKMLQQISPTDYEKLPKTFPNIDTILASHKHIVEEKLIKYSNYSTFTTNDIKAFEVQESILKKYVWSMVYHNYMVNRYNKQQYFINTQGNCERRHMKLVIHVIDNEGKIINT